MLFAKKLLVLIFVFQCTSLLRAQITSSCSLGPDIYTCNSTINITTKSLLPGTWKVYSGGGDLVNSSMSTVTINNLPEGISKFIWSNNDGSCADTISVIIPKIGSTTVSVLPLNNGVISPTECKVSFGSTLKFNNIGSVFPSSNGKRDSSVAYFLYTCQPSAVPNVLQDGCVDKVKFENINNTINDGQLVKSKPTTNQTYWVVPVLSNGITLQGPQVDPTCQKTGVPIKFTFLNDITFTIKDNCKDGISEIIFSGGDAEFFGSKFSISNIVTKKGIFSSTFLGHGEKLIISNLINGETISFEVTDAIGYKKKVSYLFPPCPACETSIRYNTSYCRYDELAKPIFDKNSGIGRVQVTPKLGLVWDTITGVVEVSKSLPGVYSIKNITSKSCVKQDSSFCTLTLLDTIPRPVSPPTATLCMPNPKVGNITEVVAQLITWYDKNGKKLDPEIDPVFDGETYYSTQTIKGCESIKVGVKVSAPKVSPPQGSPIQFVCKDNKPTIADLQPNGNIFYWYSSPEGGEKLNSTTPLLETKYYASIKLTCESQQRLEVSVKYDSPNPPILTTDTLKYCFSKELTVDSLVPNGNGFSWFAKPNDLIPMSHSEHLEQGTYYVSTFNGLTKCYSKKVKVRIFVTELLANVTVYEPNCDAYDGLLVSSASQGVSPYSYSWSTGFPGSTLSDIAAGEYLLNVKDKNGCKLDTLIHLDCRKKISSILTPNGDGKNDFFVVGYSDRFPTVKVYVYNRWGNLVYESPVPYKDNWDGKSNVLINSAFVTEGTYYYQIFTNPESKPESGFIEVVK